MCQGSYPTPWFIHSYAMFTLGQKRQDRRKLIRIAKLLAPLKRWHKPQNLCQAILWHKNNEVYPWDMVFSKLCPLFILLHEVSFRDGIYVMITVSFVYWGTQKYEHSKSYNSCCTVMLFLRRQRRRKRRLVAMPNRLKYWVCNIFLRSKELESFFT